MAELLFPNPHIFSKQEVIIGNPDAFICVCTTWSKMEVVIRDHLQPFMATIAIVGNLYSLTGIEIMISTFLANPHLRYLLMTGIESGQARGIIEGLARNPASLKSSWLTPKHTQRFIEQVKVVSTRNEEIAGLLQGEQFRDPAFEDQQFELIKVVIPEPSLEIFPAAPAGHVIHAGTIRQAYIQLLREIRTFGNATGQDSEGHIRQELWQLSVVITEQDPCDFASVPHPEFKALQIQKYCEDFWLGKEPEDVAYRYGYIMRYQFGDQVERMIQAFKAKTETFRTYISLWDPEIEHGSITMEDPPCLVSLHPRVRNNRLDLWAYIRTNDMFAGWTANAAMLRYWQHRLLEQLQRELGRPDLQLGPLTITSGSAHLYRRQWTAVDTFLAQRHIQKLVPDPKGNFHVMVDGEQIIVRHFGPDSRMLQIFRGSSADELEGQLSSFISQPSHALYLGRELQKAEFQLRHPQP